MQTSDIVEKNEASGGDAKFVSMDELWTQMQELGKPSMWDRGKEWSWPESRYHVNIELFVDNKHVVAKITGEGPTPHRAMKDALSKV